MRLHGRSSFPRTLAALMALLVLAGVAGAWRPPVASAHPLGNFTINRYSRIEPGEAGIHVRYVVDMAEIPTFQEMAVIDQDRDGQVSGAEHSAYLADKAEELRRGLNLSVNDRLVPLRVVDRELSFPPGQGGLATLRLRLDLQGQLRSMAREQQVYYQDANYPQRLGWQEIVAAPGDGVALLSATVPQQDRSNELRSYPQDFLDRPPDQREARLTFIVGASATTQESAESAIQVRIASPARRTGGDPLTALITADRLTAPAVALALALTLGLGALHAVSPGHGKTIMAAYLVGTRGTAVHALFLGLTVTISHTVGVLALGLVTLYAANVVAPERLYPWLGLASGATVMAIGAWLLLRWLRHRHDFPDHGHWEHDQHHHHHDHPHGHDHPHLGGGGLTLGVTWRNLTALGVAGGILPSASALVILLAAVSLHRVGLGLLLILAFSAGMAAVLAGIGLILVYARRTAVRFQSQSPRVARLAALMPLATGLLVLGSGLVVTARAALQIGWL